MATRSSKRARRAPTDTADIADTTAAGITLTQMHPDLGVVVKGISAAALASADQESAVLRVLATALSEHSLIVLRGGKSGVTPEQLRQIYTKLHRQLG